MNEQILNEILNNIKEFREETNKRIDNLEKDMNNKLDKVYERIDRIEKDRKEDRIQDRIQVATIAENLEIILKNFTRESEERSNKKYSTTEIIQNSIQERQTDLEQRVIKLEKTVYSRRAN